MASKVIMPASPLPALTDNRTVIQGDIDGDGDPDVAINGKRQVTGNGLTISGNNCVVSGLAITNTPKMGIAAANVSGCRIFGCHVGVSLSGMRRLSRRFANVYLFKTTFCEIGGTAAGQRNIIAGGDGTDGSVGIGLAGAEDTRVVNNYIGVARDGKTAFGGKAIGVEMTTPDSIEPMRNSIGGSRSSGEGNVFGGLSYGVTMFEGAENVIAGNNFGLASDGDTVLPLSLAGVHVRGGSWRNLIGGSGPDTRNVFAGAAEAGVAFSDSGTGENEVQGNYFGTNVAGTAQRWLGHGLCIQLNAGAQTFGGGGGRGNYFAVKHPRAFVTRAIFLDNAGDGTLIRGNTIGVRPDGRRTRGMDHGVNVMGASARILGNVIANADAGVILAFSDSRIFRNAFRSCAAGVHIALEARPLLGNLSNPRTTDDGGNVFAPTNTWYIRNSTPNRIRAEGCDFGTTSRSAIDAKIYDNDESASSGRVDFDPLIGGVHPTAVAPALSLTSATAMPTGSGGAEIAFSLSVPTAVTIDVLNIAGRPVATVIRGQAADAGTQRVIWSGQTPQGTRVPSGSYLVRVTARNSDGEQAQALTMVRVER
jgi:hypothetical protein